MIDTSALDAALVPDHEHHELARSHRLAFAFEVQSTALIASPKADKECTSHGGGGWQRACGLARVPRYAARIERLADRGCFTPQ